MNSLNVLSEFMIQCHVHYIFLINDVKYNMIVFYKFLIPWLLHAGQLFSPGLVPSPASAQLSKGAISLSSPPATNVQGRKPSTEAATVQQISQGLPQGNITFVQSKKMGILKSLKKWSCKFKWICTSHLSCFNYLVNM